MTTSQRTIRGFLCAALVLLGGCGKTPEAAYAQGWNEGHEAGVAEGRDEGRFEAEAGHQGRWGMIGLAVGGLVGASLVALATRRHLAAQWRIRKRRKEVVRRVGHCKEDLDADLHAEVLAIARKSAELRERLGRDDGPLITLLHDRLRPDLARLDTQLLEIAALLQQLRDLRRESVTETEAAAGGTNPSPPPVAGEPAEAATLRELRAQRREAVAKNAQNIARCESQLAGIAAFLDELWMRLGNLKAIEQADAFARVEREVGEEIDALGAAYEATLARLTG